MAGTSKYLRARQVKLEIQLEMQGGGVPYTVVGSTFEPGEGASFMFYVYTDAPHDVVALDADWRGARDEQKPEVLQPPHHATPPCHAASPHQVLQIITEPRDSYLNITPYRGECYRVIPPHRVDCYRVIPPHQALLRIMTEPPRSRVPMLLSRLSSTFLPLPTRSTSLPARLQEASGRSDSLGQGASSVREEPCEAQREPSSTAEGANPDPSLDSSSVSGQLSPGSARSAP